LGHAADNDVPCRLLELLALAFPLPLLGLRRAIDRVRRMEMRLQLHGPLPTDDGSK